ncbi:MBL fold metallo-hydrolase [Pseudoclavibacter alba]|uniref:MBL fold metallo-hydrolase n=1 Tax=Pseudoclavibacter albus TaxID=272241 RepID=UPI0019D23BC7|nr:MBL fold metallo-hydrolase [Pseudoclavibacter alba]MBN6777257.1 MBL fold metallo-hydrolase [Pseudoclavibacter alba]
MTAHIDHAVTSGTFTLDGETFDVDNNVWVIGDDSECIVFDAPHDVETVVQLVGGRTVTNILCTHAHDDHIRHVFELTERVNAPILLHADDAPVWRLTHERQPDAELHDGDEFTVGGTTLRVIHTPGHSPGSCSFYVEELGVVFTGDTLFEGGPGATGRSFSSKETILESIREKLFALPAETVVKAGHGPDTTIGAEQVRLEAE